MPTRDESWPNGTPCWIDVMVTDPDAAKQFYSGLFGWDIQEGPPEAGGYAMCILDGQPVAAISPKPVENPFPNVWSTYLATDDLDATVARARAAGSTFMMEPMDVMTAGRMAFAMDPTGAAYGIWQAGDHKGVGIYNEPGALAWNELMTHDYEGAKAFYGKVFGYTYDDIGDDTFTYSAFRRRGDGRIVGGVGQLPSSTPAEAPPTWVIYFGVEDCDASVATAVELGGTVLRVPADTSFGRMATVTGPQGEVFSLMQAPPRGEDIP